MENYFAGKVVELRQGVYGSDQPVLNVIVETTKQVFGGIKIGLKKTVVLFNANAKSAQAKLAVGDHGIFEVKRSPRIYDTTKGTRVETVEMVSQSFNKISAVDYKKSIADIEKTFPSFDFTDDDRAVAMKAFENKVSDEPEDTDLDEIMA